MIYYLLTCLLVLLILSYILNGRNIISAWFVSIGMYTLSVSAAIIFADYFQTEITIETALVIISALTVLGFGELTVKLMSVEKKISDAQNIFPVREDQPIILSSGEIYTICLFMLSVLVFYFKFMYDNALIGGNFGDLFLTVQYARQYMTESGAEYSIGFLLGQSVVLSECLAYFCIYIYFKNRFLFNIRQAIYLFPALIYALQLVNSTGRTGYIKLITVMCMIAFIFIKKSVNWDNKNDIKIIKYGVLAIFGFFIFFRLFGYLTETSIRNELWNNFADYLGAPIIGLDIYLNNPTAEENILFGQETLRNVYIVLGQLGFDIPWYSAHAEFFTWGSGSSNVYTGLRKLIQDYSLFGMYIVQYFIGIIYALFIYNIKKKTCGGKLVIVYSMMFYPIAMTAIGDVFSTIIGTTFVYQMIYLYIIYWYFISRKNRYSEHSSKRI